MNYVLKETSLQITEKTCAAYALSIEKGLPNISKLKSRGSIV